MTILENLKKILLTEIAVDLGKKSLDADEEVVPEDFQTVSMMVRFVEQKMQTK